MTDRRYVHLTGPQLRARINDLRSRIEQQDEVLENLRFSREELLEELSRRVEG